MSETRPLGLYIHIPFCRSKCFYCDFYSLPRSENRMDGYCEALRAALRAAAPDASGRTVDTIYFGGGTPSLLGPVRLMGLLEAVFELFAVSPGAEITLEANPESAGDPQPLRLLRRAGFNRISLGMQSADDEELRAVGRVHSRQDTEKAVAAARTAGFSELSLDLIYGLPGQSRESWRGSLAAAVSLMPEHLSCYGLKVEPGTPLHTRRAEISLPDDDTQADMYLDAAAFLEQEGYKQYEISNFALPGHPSRHNRKYWTLGEYLGFGPGAHSDFRGRRFAVARDLDAFLRGERLLSEDAAISPRERVSERVMLGLRTAEGIDLSALPVPFAGAETLLSELAAHGLARFEGNRWHLTPRGFLVSNEVIVRVLDALGI